MRAKYSKSTIKRNMISMIVKATKAFVFAVLGSMGCPEFPPLVLFEPPPVLLESQGTCTPGEFGLLGST